MIQPLKYARANPSSYPEYNAWAGAKARCTNPNHHKYHRYGGRGIKMLFKTFEDFYNHVGERPSKSHTIDRIDNDGDYTYGNVRWATKSEQAQNRCNSRMITYEGETKNLQAWANELQCGYGTLQMRLNRGWSVEKAFTHPIRVLRGVND